jgi:hypothetical protein
MNRTVSVADLRARAALFLALALVASATHTAPDLDAAAAAASGSSADLDTPVEDRPIHANVLSTQVATPIGVNFTGLTMADTIAEVDIVPDTAPYQEIKALAQRGLSPPDTIGAVGPHHIVTLINGAYAVYDKTGGRLDSGALSTFWSDAGIANVQQQPVVYDPVVQYDVLSQRWFALAEDNSFGNATSPNRILLAISHSSDPTAGWKGYTWASNSPNTDSDDQLWADQATLGFNRDGVIIAANMFQLGRNDFPPDCMSIFALPKEDLLRGVPNEQLTVTRFDRLDREVTGYFVQPAIDLDDTSGRAILLADLANVGLPGRFKLSLLTGDIRSPQLDTSVAPIDLRPYGTPPAARQPDGAGDIDTGDSQFMLAPSLIVRHGSLWGVESVESNDRVALRWFEIDTRTGTLRQEGLMGYPYLDFYYGSIAVNEFGDVVLGFNGSGTGEFIGSYAAIGRPRGGMTAFGIPFLLKEGVDTYEYKLSPTMRRNRWGDYSGTVVDPEDPRSFWTFQEFVLDRDRWGTQISQIRVAPR